MSVAFAPVYLRGAAHRLPIYDISGMPPFPMGGKNWLIEEKGIFVLERGPGTLRTIACTHAGSGTFLAYDGVPNADGEFSHENSRVINEFLFENGRRIYKANPPVMGSWMMDGGFIHGLTVVAIGGQASTSTIATVVWVGVRIASRG